VKKQIDVSKEVNFFERSPSPLYVRSVEQIVSQQKENHEQAKDGNVENRIM
jgi:hypothetical protein